MTTVNYQIGNSNVLLQSDFTLIDSEAQRWNKIKQLRDSYIQTAGYKVNNDWFHSDTFSRTQQIGLVLLGNNIPAGLKWKTMQGTFVDMTPALAIAIFNAAAVSDTASFSHAELLKNNTSLDINSGWPERYSAS